MEPCTVSPAGPLLLYFGFLFGVWPVYFTILFAGGTVVARKRGYGDREGRAVNSLCISAVLVLITFVVLGLMAAAQHQ